MNKVIVLLLAWLSMATMFGLLAIYFELPAVLFPGLGFASWVFLIYLIHSPVTFFLYAYDKGVAGTTKRRIPEAALHFSELLGGWPGGLLARPLLRHKTNWGNKTVFKLINWFIIFIHLGFWAWYFFFR